MQKTNQDLLHAGRSYAIFFTLSKLSQKLWFPLVTAVPNLKQFLSSYRLHCLWCHFRKMASAALISRTVAYSVPPDYHCICVFTNFYLITDLFVPSQLCDILQLEFFHIFWYFISMWINFSKLWIEEVHQHKTEDQFGSVESMGVHWF